MVERNMDNASCEALSSRRGRLQRGRRSRAKPRPTDRGLMVFAAAPPWAAGRVGGAARSGNAGKVAQALRRLRPRAIYVCGISLRVPARTKGRAK
jgi:hypothetical protein